MPARRIQLLRQDSAIEAASGYLASEAHYLSVAGRILAALHGDVSVVLVTGDPTADPHLFHRLSASWPGRVTG